MGYYPILLEMTDRPCLVVGGGRIAEGKVRALLEAGTAVTVVSPTLTPALAELVAEGRIGHRAREYEAGDLDGQALVFVATDDGSANAAVAADGRRRHVWVNAADDPAHCDFILPSVLRRGDLVVAVATGGASPALSRVIREELEAYFTDDYAALTGVVSDVRRDLRGRGRRVEPERWRAALAGDVRRLVADGRLDEARAHLSAELGAEPCRARLLEGRQSC